jgi:hypothetical protein
LSLLQLHNVKVASSNKKKCFIFKILKLIFLSSSLLQQLKLNVVIRIKMNFFIFFCYLSVEFYCLIIGYYWRSTLFYGNFVFGSVVELISNLPFKISISSMPLSSLNLPLNFPDIIFPYFVIVTFPEFS